MPEDVDDCVKSILEDNPDMDESTAYAICNDMDNRGVLEDFLDAEPADDGVGALAEFRNPAEIQRVEESGGTVRYKQVMLLAPGVWTDAGSRETILYAGEAIRDSADDWDDNEINLLHGPALHNSESMGSIGEIPMDSIIVDDQDRLFGDLVLHGDSPASELGIELMDEVLQAAQDSSRETPPVGPSVEISDDRVEFDDDRGLQVMQEMTFSGLGIVFNPASRPAEIGQQVRERQVAMAEDLDVPEGGIVVRDEDDSSGGSLKSGSRLAGTMSGSEREQVSKLLAEIGDAIEEVQRTLQDESEMDMVQQLIAQFEEDGHDLQSPVTEFVSWIEENADVDQDEIMDVLEAYLEGVEAESFDATPVEGLQSWIDDQSGGEGEEDGDGPEDEGSADGDGEGGDGEGDGPEDDEEGTMSADELQDAKQTIAEFSQHLDDVKDMLQEDRSQREDLRDDLEDLDRRLSEIEDEPQTRSMAEPKDTDFVDLDDEDDGDDTDYEHQDVMI